MREYRGTLTEGGRESPWRDRAVEDNLRLFQEVSEVALCNSSTLSIIIT
jgi:glutaminyl-tRNA synthetase